MRLAVLQVTPQKSSWCAQLGKALPDLEVTVETHFFEGPDKGSLEIVRLKGQGAARATAIIEANPLVSDLQVLESGRDELLLRIRVKGCMLPKAVAETGVLPQLPYAVRAGCHRWCILGQGSKLEAFADSLRRHGGAVEAVFVGTEDAEGSLTERQRHILRRAIDVGYYDVPRRTSLSQLAGKIGVSKATMCETLQLIEKKVMARVDADSIVAAGAS